MYVYVCVYITGICVLSAEFCVCKCNQKFICVCLCVCVCVCVYMCVYISQAFVFYQQSLSDAIGSMGDVFTGLMSAAGAADKVFELIGIYIYICIYVCIYIYIYIHVYVYVYIYITH